MIAAFLALGHTARPVTWLAIAYSPPVRPVHAAPANLKRPDLSPLETAALANLCAALSYEPENAS